MSHNGQTSTQLSDVLSELRLDAELDLDGRWARLHGELCEVFVAELKWGRGYITWCDHPAERTVEFYRDPRAAIRTGLSRAADPGRNREDD